MEEQKQPGRRGDNERSVGIRIRGAGAHSSRKRWVDCLEATRKPSLSVPSTQCNLWPLTHYQRTMVRAGRPNTTNKVTCNTEHSLSARNEDTLTVRNGLCQVKNGLQPARLEEVTSKNNNRICDVFLAGRHTNFMAGLARACDGLSPLRTRPSDPQLNLSGSDFGAEESSSYTDMINYNQNLMKSAECRFYVGQSRLEKRGRLCTGPASLTL